MGWGAALLVSSLGFGLFIAFAAGADRWMRLKSILGGWFTRN